MKIALVALTVLALVLFAVGWTAAKTWGLVQWTLAALQEGWYSARIPAADGGGT